MIAMRDQWVSRAIRKGGGSQAELARRIRIKPEKISYILNRAKKISLEDALLIEDATNGEVSCFHLVEYLDPKIRKKLENRLTVTINPKFSESIALAMAFEAEFCERRGRPKQNNCRNLDELKGRTDEIVAKKYGFFSKDRYRQAKKIVQLGVTELIDALDNQQLSLSLAAKLAKLSATEQRRLLQLSKKEILNQLRKIVQKSDTANSYSSLLELNEFITKYLQLCFYLMPSIEGDDAA